MKGEHEHNWRYNEAKFEVLFDGSGARWIVIRFCDRCLEVETLFLVEKKK